MMTTNHLHTLHTSFKKDESGAVLTEFALTLSLYFTLVIAIIEFALAMYAHHFTSFASGAAVRFAMVRGSSWQAACTSAVPYSCNANSSTVTSYVQSILSKPLVTSRTSVTTTWPGIAADNTACDASDGLNSPGCIVRVKVTYNFNYVLPFMPKNVLVMSSTSSATILQ